MTDGPSPGYHDLPVTWKVQPKLLHLARPLAECAEQSQILTGRAYRPLAPLNLRVFGDGVHPEYGTGLDIEAAWDESSPRRSVTPPEENLTDSWTDTVLLEVLDPGTLAVKGTWSFAPGTTGTIPNAELVAALGAETSFILRAYNRRAGLNSPAFDQVAVTKV